MVPSESLVKYSTLIPVSHQFDTLSHSIPRQIARPDASGHRTAYTGDTRKHMITSNCSYHLYGQFHLTCDTVMSPDSDRSNSGPILTALFAQFVTDERLEPVLARFALRGCALAGRIASPAVLTALTALRRARVGLGRAPAIE